MDGYVSRVSPKQGDSTTRIRNSPFAHGKRILLFFIQELFKEPNPTGLIYSTDDKVTQILIKGTYARNQETYSKKPIVVVERGGVHIQSRTLGSIESVNYRDGGYVRTELAPSSLVVRILSENSYKAEEIAWFVASTTFVLRHVLIRQGFYHVGNQFMIGPPSPPIGQVPGDQSPLIMIEMTLPCSYLLQMSTTPLNRPILRDVNVIYRDSQTHEQVHPTEETSQD